jgi:hypothetical protein
MQPARITVAFLTPAIVTSALCLLVYATVQQNYRQSLNDPQIQLAEDSARAFSAGAPVRSLIPDSRIDIEASLAPWVAAYDQNGQALFSSGLLQGEMPQPPKGVFDAARTGVGKDTDYPVENRVTWEAGPGVRQAIVVVYYNNESNSGYVVAGRNMREVEDRERSLAMVVLVVWALTMTVSLCFTAFAVRYKG